MFSIVQYKALMGRARGWCAGGCLSLRKSPTTSQMQKAFPVHTFSHGQLISADRKVEVNGSVFVSPCGLDGWLFVTRDEELLLIAVADATRVHDAVRPPTSCAASEIRHLTTFRV